jgi:hypothetical protein
MTLAADLKKLSRGGVYAQGGRVERRWGQLLREAPRLQEAISAARERGVLVPLAELAAVSSGVVTRANAFFVVRELPFDQVPERFGVTTRDYERVAVVEDGLKTLHKIERTALRPILKGPEALVGPSTVASSDQRLFDVQDRSKEELRKLHCNGILAYLRRGETVNYTVSSDRLKGGVPAQRSNIRNRKPYWYSVHAPASAAARLAVPEHFDERFVAALLPAGHDAVVIDTLYSVVPADKRDAPILLAALNSILTWYQLELRGRTQHGEGVLKVKIADWEGVLVINPAAPSDVQTEVLLDAFAPLAGSKVAPVDEELHRPERVAFDLAYLNCCGFDDPESVQLDLERGLRAGIAERHERAGSVAAAKAGRTAAKRTAANVDAFASRIAASFETYPDPRSFVNAETPMESVLVLAPFEGELTVGEDLFTLGDVFAGRERVASTRDAYAAQFVRGVLLHDPETPAVEVPVSSEDVRRVVEAWDAARAEWRKTFDSESMKQLEAIADVRLREEVKERALALLHAR